LQAHFENGMKRQSQYFISVANLAEKTHFYEWEGGKKFFDSFENSIVEQGDFMAKVTLEKSSTMLQLYFDIKGTLVLTCDRSLEEFEFPFHTQQKLILKYGEEDEQLTDEIEIINRDTQEINVSQYIYEFIGLATPMKKLHPKFQSEDDEVENESSTLVYSSDESSENDEIEENTKTDPRWEILKKLKSQQ
jgi:uncharacterized metal-binding protein YceD (DUF177 family)